MSMPPPDPHHRHVVESCVIVAATLESQFHPIHPPVQPSYLLFYPHRIYYFVIAGVVQTSPRLQAGTAISKTNCHQKPDRHCHHLLKTDVGGAEEQQRNLQFTMPACLFDINFLIFECQPTTCAWNVKPYLETNMDILSANQLGL
jgi:hypothetical protein